MKKFTLIAVLLTSFLFISKRSAAQDYNTAVGLKFGGYENGLSVKYFMNSTTAIEGIVGIRSHGAVLTGLYELHQPAFNTPLLKFYYGFGAHAGSVGKGVYKRFGSDDNVYNDNHILLGADGVLGLEYKLKDSPIAFSLDLNPRLELATGPFFDLAPGLGLKYAF
ncbi:MULTISPECIES: hypothetical protein [unclassified Mucilaginibacter]|uniref:hypothetical protein n=1 Tax=unclassified Mucilaginibacter TaxID=2617802 RepID=UPI002AC9EE3E|nr:MULTISPECIES: hypothetical protein [unclassified Mucilaginibacter]MEB0262354.1 hypothetical protein [Mucilaginibacter sp. 10I4]MEB0279334.1 hypothetical protein [Mucilaginibacter sp. 10B2]MEB0303145.1 hypothetical protein [Mucilaginibacter sp. 5C4]WPX23154.1 hypothetical protein RHM67_17885 [Mucilaginibacter sp. 5C4]